MVELMGQKAPVNKYIKKALCGVRTRVGRTLLALVLVIQTVGCTGQTVKNRYIFAEKLWSDQQYAAAVAEFEKVAVRDPQGQLGLQALFRAAMTQTLYLAQYPEAIQKFSRLAENSKNPEMAWESQLQIGEILYAKTEQYDQAIQHYNKLLQLRPQTPEAAEFIFRIGKAHFFRWEFSEAISSFEELMKKYPTHPLAEKALYEIGMSQFTRASQTAQSGETTPQFTFQQAIDTFNRFIKQYPSSSTSVLAKFGIASCLEEMDQLDAAYTQYEAIKSEYPAPEVIQVKLMRIKERKAQRSR